MASQRHGWATSWIGIYLLIGLAFQLIYFGVPGLLRLGSWLHVLAWPAYVVLGMLRRLFLPFAFVALLGLIGFLAVTRWLRTGR